ncbi:YcxB family protein [Kordia sp.]|uniref:YcxB family protein n=1 Tax=Kordia sp. TaxID=1965332 RepID=UPI0025BFE758|nr:YcxB family protein [Kordia sp.]MCH2196208.1 YcxB family protein [Kordia sp.]
MIDTKTYQLTSKKYRKIFFFIFGRSLLQLSPFLIVWTLLLGWQLGRLIALYSLIALVILGFSYLILTFVKNLEPFFSETQVQFNDETLQLTSNGKSSSWRMGELKNVIIKEDYWLVYVTKIKYTYIPHNIFYSEDDFKKFKTYINA